jgi:hypothetical protein
MIPVSPNCSTLKFRKRMHQVLFSEFCPKNGRTPCSRFQGVAGARFRA